MTDEEIFNLGRRMGKRKFPQEIPMTEMQKKLESHMIRINGPEGEVLLHTKDALPLALEQIKVLESDLKMCQEIGVEMQREVNRKLSAKKDRLESCLKIAMDALENNKVYFENHPDAKNFRNTVGFIGHALEQINAKMGAKDAMQVISNEEVPADEAWLVNDGKLVGIITNIDQKGPRENE